MIPVKWLGDSETITQVATFARTWIPPSGDGSYVRFSAYDCFAVVWDQMMRFENDEMPMVTSIREKFEVEGHVF